LANQMLAYNGIANAAIPFDYKPTKRGGGGALKVLWWQAPTLLNPHFAVGTKDQEACRIFYEPMAAWDRDGNLVPVLASELPDLEKDTLSRDGKTVTWTISRSGFTSTSRRHSGPIRSSASAATSSRSTCSSPTRARSRARRPITS